MLWIVGLSIAGLCAIAVVRRSIDPPDDPFEPDERVTRFDMGSEMGFDTTIEGEVSPPPDNARRRRSPPGSGPSP